MTKILTLNIIVCVDDKIFCVIRKNELHYDPGQARPGQEGERLAEK